jgi:hypothetical protein
MNHVARIRSVMQLKVNDWRTNIRARGPINSCGNAGVSATYSVVNALVGKTLVAAEYAEYAAYATVYGEGGSGAVADPESFEPEFSWQVEALTALARDQRRDRSLHCESGR